MGTAPPPVDLPDVPAATGAAARTAPRFVAATEVELALPGRDEVRHLYTHDISKGGLFVATSEPPPLRTQVSVTLKTPDGDLQLHAEVVHVLEPAMAAQIGHPAGVGLEIVRLDDDAREALTRYIDGLAARLGPEVGHDQDEAQAAEDALAVLRAFLQGLDTQDPYLALSLPMNASHDDIQTAVSSRRALFEAPPAGVPPAQKARFQNAVRLLDKVASLVGDPRRRLTHDVEQGRAPGADRFFDAETHGASRGDLRSLWMRAHPDAMDQAAALAGQAMSAAELPDMATAHRLGTQALNLDPFNDELRRAVEGWEFQREVDSGLLDEALDEDDDDD